MAASDDLFLSYRWADKPSVEPLLDALRTRGVRVWQDAREVEDLASIQRSVSTGLSGARALLAWYSVRYNDSRACQWELTAAYCAAQAEGDPRRRILVVNPESGNAHVHLPDLFDQLHFSAQGVPDEAATVAALADRIKAALHDTVPDTPLGAIGALTPPRWLPSIGTGSIRFVGRLSQMWRLHGQLQAGQAAMLTGIGGKPGMALVRGAGGIGKSLMAEEYALRFGAAYPGGVFWLRAYGHPDGGPSIAPAQRVNLRDAQMLDLAVGLGIDTHGLEAAQVRAAMAGHFAREGLAFLWIIDDLPSELGNETLGDWLAPHTLGRTLFTSRTRRFSHVPTIDLPQLDPGEARDLLTRRRVLTPEEAEVADAICAALGHHALAVDVTATLVERRGLEGTLKALEREDQDVLDLAAQFEEALPNGHQRHISAMFLESIGQLDEAARDLLRLAAVLAAAPIPKPLLVRGVAEGTGIDEGYAQDRTDLAVDRLLSSGLADDAGNGAITVHTLVSRTTRFSDRSLDALVPWRECAARVLTEEMRQAADIRLHTHLEPWVEHARELTGTADDLASVNLLGWVARYDFERAAYALARSGFEREREFHERVLGEEHRDTLTSMNNLASTLQEQGDLPGARRLQESVLDIRKRVLGDEHPDTMTSMSNLATTLQDQGELHGARRLQESVLEIRKRELGEEHPSTLTSMSNLASTLQRQGDLLGARRLHEPVLEIRKRVLGREHPETLMSINNLAITLQSQGDLPGARQLLEDLLKVRKRVMGEEHPDTLKSMSNLAGTLQSQGDLPGARRLEESALEIRKRVLGDEHLDTLTSMNNLSATLWSQGDLPAARRLQESVLEIRKRVLGEDHPHTLTSMNNLAATLWNLDDLPGARRLEESVLDARKRLLGEAHPDTLTSMNNLAATLRGQGDLPGARLLEEAALEARKRVLGEGHPDTLTSMNNLAGTLWDQGDFLGARLLQETCVAGLALTLGPTHAHTVQATQTLMRMDKAIESNASGRPTWWRRATRRLAGWLK